MENLKSLLSYGNSKLPKSTAIFNLGSAKNCPSDRLGLCELSGICYAKKAERMYPSVLPYRERQREYFSEATAEQFVSEFVEATKRKKIAINKLRVNESGDFENDQDIEKMEKIATMLKAYGVRVYAYSARKDLNFSGCEALQVIGSNFMGNLQFKGVQGAAKVVEESKKQGNNNFVLCVGDCKKCSICAVAKNKTVLCEIH